jgi:hypothetical protein
LEWGKKKLSMVSFLLRKRVNGESILEVSKE